MFRIVLFLAVFASCSALAGRAHADPCSDLKAQKRHSLEDMSKLLKPVYEDIRVDDRIPDNDDAGKQLTKISAIVAPARLSDGMAEKFKGEVYSKTARTTSTTKIEHAKLLYIEVTDGSARCVYDMWARLHGDTYKDISGEIDLGPAADTACDIKRVFGVYHGIPVMLQYEYPTREVSSENARPNRLHVIRLDEQGQTCTLRK